MKGGIKVKRLHPHAKMPTVAHPGEDLGYDLYCLEDIALEAGVVTKVRTGIAVSAGFMDGEEYVPCGLLLRDRSSMASKGVTLSGGVIDAGYRGEIVVLLTYRPHLTDIHQLHYLPAECKIAQAIPTPVLTGGQFEVDELEEGARGDKGFGSSGE